MHDAEKFWVLPCLDRPDERYVIYTENKAEILVEVKHGKIIYHSAALSEDHRTYFEKNVLTN